LSYSASAILAREGFQNAPEPRRHRDYVPRSTDQKAGAVPLRNYFNEYNSMFKFYLISFCFFSFVSYGSDYSLKDTGVLNLVKELIDNDNCHVAKKNTVITPKKNFLIKFDEEIFNDYKKHLKNSFNLILTTKHNFRADIEDIKFDLFYSINAPGKRKKIEILTWKAVRGKTVYLYFQEYKIIDPLFDRPNSLPENDENQDFSSVPELSAAEKESFLKGFYNEEEIAIPSTPAKQNEAVENALSPTTRSLSMEFPLGKTPEDIENFLKQLHGNAYKPPQSKTEPSSTTPELSPLASNPPSLSLGKSSIGNVPQESSSSLPIGEPDESLVNLLLGIRTEDNNDNLSLDAQNDNQSSVLRTLPQKRKREWADCFLNEY
jgi:hypothetical protein